MTVQYIETKRGGRMSNHELMRSALKEYTFPLLKERGFAGKYPNFRRKLDDRIELISFQTNKWGGSFTIEVSVVFPGSADPNYTLYEGVAEETFGVEATNKRYRLPGMYDGWFYYRDLYRKRTLFLGAVYHDVSEKESVHFIPPIGYKLVQKFDYETAVQICNEINLQFDKAYQWLATSRS
jgi:hypothetical protein